MFFGPIGRWPFLWLAETFSTSFLKPLNEVCQNFKEDKNSTSSTKFVFIGPIGKNKMVSVWLKHLRLLLWNCWTEFVETWQEARTQCLLPSLCFSRKTEKQDCRPGLWLAETFSTIPLILTSFTKFIFYGPMEKQPWSLIVRDILDFLSRITEWNLIKLNRKQELNILYQVFVFRADWKTKMAGLADPSNKVAHCTQVHDMWPFGPLVF